MSGTGLSGDVVRLLDWVAHLVTLTERRTDDIAGHGQRVAELCQALSDPLELPADERAILWHAARLHDIGILVISDSLFHLPGPVGEEQEALFRSHSRVGADLLGALQGAGALVPLVLHHHERVDARGYPEGVTGDRLSLPEHVLIVANAFDAMVNPRPYLWHQALSPQQAAHRLQQGRGAAYDARVVDAWESAHIVGGGSIYAGDHGDQLHAHRGQER